MVKFRISLLSLSLILCISPVMGKTLRLAVAANFAPIASDILNDYTKQNDVTIEISIGSTGALFAQILHGAPFDLFLAADAARPKALEEAGLIFPNSSTTYAQGLLAIWSRNGIPPHMDECALLQWLLDTHRLVIANTITAPYGTAARQVLERLGIPIDNTPQLIQANNVMQAVHYIDSGNAHRGIVAYHLVKDKQGVALLPRNLYSPIAQQLVVLKRSEHLAESLALAEYLSSNEVRRDLQLRGFSQ